MVAHNPMPNFQPQLVLRRHPSRKAITPSFEIDYGNNVAPTLLRSVLICQALNSDTLRQWRQTPYRILNEELNVLSWFDERWSNTTVCV